MTDQSIPVTETSSVSGVDAKAWRAIAARMLRYVPVIGVAAVLSLPILAIAPYLCQLLPVAPQGSDGGTVFMRTVVELGNVIATHTIPLLTALIVGAGVGAYAPGSTWGTRMGTAFVSSMTAAGIGMLGVRMSWLVVDSNLLIWWIAGTSLGGLVGHGIAKVGANSGRRHFRIFPEWFGASRALLWVPLAIAVGICAIYVVAAALVAVIAAVAIVVSLAIVWGILRALVGGDGSVTRRDTSGNIVGSSKENNGFRGKEVVHKDNVGNIVGTSKEHDGFWGKQTEHKDVDGHLIGKTEERDGFFGKRTDIRDENGNFDHTEQRGNIVLVKERK